MLPREFRNRRFYNAANYLRTKVVLLPHKYYLFWFSCVRVECFLSSAS